MGGFAAATYKRGISFINIPTTLTAMIDASIGGKTGIDWMGYKNLIGCFHNPLAIYVQPAFLNTLDLRQIQSGVVEMWKHALIDSPEAWEKIRHKAPADCIGLEFIQTSIKIKNNLVRIDPLDQKERQALNVGHSLGHAIEALALQQNKKLLHGEAVLFGMIYECSVAENLLGLTPSLREQLLQLKQHYFPELAIFWNMEDLIPFLMQDKKNQEGIRMSLLAHPGDVRIGCLVSMEEILKISLHD
jgi:3-dehydroquinate synthase